MSHPFFIRAALFLAIAIIVQSLRLIFPFIPAPVNQFVLGSIINMMMVLAMLTTGNAWTAAIGIVLPLVAFLTGQLPLAPMIIVVGIGNVIYMVLAWRLFPRKAMYAAPIFKALLLFLGAKAVTSMLELPDSAANVITLMMSWPQIITGTMGIIAAKKLLPRINQFRKSIT